MILQRISYCYYREMPAPFPNHNLSQFASHSIPNRFPDCRNVVHPGRVGEAPSALRCLSSIRHSIIPQPKPRSCIRPVNHRARVPILNHQVPPHHAQPGNSHPHLRHTRQRRPSRYTTTPPPKPKKRQHQPNRKAHPQEPHKDRTGLQLPASLAIIC